MNVGLWSSKVIELDQVTLEECHNGHDTSVRNERRLLSQDSTQGRDCWRQERLAKTGLSLAKSAPVFSKLHGNGEEVVEGEDRDARGGEG